VKYLFVPRKYVDRGTKYIFFRRKYINSSKKYIFPFVFSLRLRTFARNPNIMLIISAVGADRPGMAHAVAQILFDCGCNIEDTTMTRLSGQFAMILAVESPDYTAQELETRLSPLRHALGLHIDVSSSSDVAGLPSEAPRFIVTAYGPEKTGLLARLTGVLAAQRANVTDVQTRVASGGSVYVMLLELELPANVDAESLEEALRAELHDLQVSLRVLEEDTL